MAKTIFSVQHAVAEILADKEQRAQYLYRLAKSRKYRMAINNLDKNRTNVFFKPVSWKSARDNEYLLVLGVSSKTDAKANGPFFLEIMLFLMDGTLNVATVNHNTEGPKVEIFKYHFFKRYNERFLKQPELDIKDVIYIFFKANPHNCYKQMESKKFNDSYAFIFPDGVSLGNFYYEKKYCVHNTFVTRMMLYKKQTENAEDLLDFIDSVSTKSFAELRDNNTFLSPVKNTVYKSGFY